MTEEEVKTLKKGDVVYNKSGHAREIVAFDYGNTIMRCTPPFNIEPTYFSQNDVELQEHYFKKKRKKERFYYYCMGTGCISNYSYSDDFKTRYTGVKDKVQPVPEGYQVDCCDWIKTNCYIEVIL